MITSLKKPNPQAFLYMGQIPQDGENGLNVAFFLSTVNCSEEILSVTC